MQKFCLGLEEGEEGQEEEEIHEEEQQLEEEQEQGPGILHPFVIVYDKHFYVCINICYLQQQENLPCLGGGGRSRLFCKMFVSLQKYFCTSKSTSSPKIENILKSKSNIKNLKVRSFTQSTEVSYPEFTKLVPAFPILLP